MADIDITDWAKLGSVIRSARKSAGMTQQQLADRSGTARSWIARIEAGHRKAELEQILRLLNALDLRMRLHSPDGLGINEPAPELRPEDRRAEAWADDAKALVADRRTTRRCSWAASAGSADRLRSDDDELPSATDDADES